MRKFMGYIAAIALVMTACGDSETDKDYSLVKAGDMMPEFTITSIDGTGFDSKEVVGKKFFIYFLASYCSDCHKATPNIIELWNQVKEDEGLEFVCIARGGSDNATLANAQEYWAEVAASCGVDPEQMPSLYYDADRSVYNKFATQSVPRYYVIDSERRISWQGEGSLSSQALKQYIQAAK